jgi:hypothetical protein
LIDYLQWSQVFSDDQGGSANLLIARADLPPNDAMNSGAKGRRAMFAFWFPSEDETIVCAQFG